MTLTAESQRGFDVVLGNPPFVNAIEGGITDWTKPIVRFVHDRIGGTADLGYYFLDQGAQICGIHGRLGMVQPRAVLNATPVTLLRQDLSRIFPPARIYAPNRSDFFAGAAVFICLLTLSRGHDLEVSIDDDPTSATWRRATIEGSNWWLALSTTDDLASGNAPRGTPLKSCFEVSASMTTGDAYDIKPFVVDEKQGEGLKLITTGLIDPDTNLWGQSTCRYLKHDYQFPRIASDAELSNSLRRRLDRARRPKVLVAGLSKRIECFLDERGECTGAVSTYSIYHPADDLEALGRVKEALLSEWATEQFRRELGGNAMGGGNTTMKKSFLEEFEVPDTTNE